jgi:hypothetical protein
VRKLFQVSLIHELPPALAGGWMLTHDAALAEIGLKPKYQNTHIPPAKAGGN